MKFEELLFRLSQAWESWNWRMENLASVAGSRVSATLVQLENSTAGEQYRILAAAIRELLNRAQQRLAELSLVQTLVGTLVDKAEQVAIKLAWAQPFIRSIPKDKVVLVSVSLVFGLMSGRLFSPSAPRLKPIFMVSTVCGSYSGVPGIAQCRIEVPRVQSSRDVLVRVMSTSLDKTDYMSVSGWGRAERRKVHGGFTLGRDFCGVVVEVGADVPHLQPGDRVWGAVPYNMPGTLSEMLVLPGTFIEKMPENLNWDGAATVPYSSLMVWNALVWCGQLKPDKSEGKRVLVVDGVTDTGCLATQLACLWGCMVTVLCPARTVPLAHALGAHTVIAARDTPEQCYRDLEDSGPFDLVVISGDLMNYTTCRPLLADKGRVCSTLPPQLPTDSWGLLRRSLLPLWRSFVLPPCLPSHNKLAQPLKYMTSAVERGKIQPVLDSVLSPLDVKTGLMRLASEQTVGKSVVVFDKI